MSLHYQSKTDKWVKCISSSGTIRAIAITATDITRLLAQRHSIQSDSGLKGLGEGLIAGLILSSYCKSGEKVNLNIQGSGCYSQAIIDANADAEVRGYIIERKPEDVFLTGNTGPWGTGLFSVLRTKFQEPKPYIGTVPILTGHIAKDLTFYWLQSEQVQSAVGIDVFTNENGVTLAEGFLIQAMPGADDKDIRFIEDHLKNLHQYNQDTIVRSTPVNLLSYLLNDQTFSILEEKNLTLSCSCSLDKVKRSLSLIGNEEIQSMIDDQKDFEIMCDFCSEKYVFTSAMLGELLT